MPRFQLTILDQDRAVLTSLERIPLERISEVKIAFERWRQGGGLLVVSEAETVSRAVKVELDLGPSEAEVRHERLDEDPYEAWAESHGAPRGEVGTRPPPPPPPDRA